MFEKIRIFKHTTTAHTFTSDMSSNDSTSSSYSIMDRIRDLVVHEQRSQRHLKREKSKDEDVQRSWRKREQIAGLFQRYSRQLTTLSQWQEMEREKGFAALVQLLRLSAVRRVNSSNSGDTVGLHPSLLIGKRCIGAITIFSSMGMMWLSIALNT